MHNLKILEDGQGGLLDILFKNELVFVSYSEDRGNGMSSTSVAKANFDTTKMKLSIFFKQSLQLILVTILVQD